MILKTLIQSKINCYHSLIRKKKLIKTNRKLFHFVKKKILKHEGVRKFKKKKKHLGISDIETSRNKATFLSSG